MIPNRKLPYFPDRSHKIGLVYKIGQKSYFSTHIIASNSKTVDIWCIFFVTSWCTLTCTNAHFLLPTGAQPAFKFTLSGTQKAYIPYWFKLS